MADTIHTIRRALLSVSDKSQLADFARFLARGGTEIVATSSTHRFLTDEGIAARAIDSYTGMPEMMRGRLRTLHPKVHGGLLACREQDAADAEKHDIEMIDLLVCNLYPFEETVARADCAFEEAIENIDIGGPAMLRAAAKNHRDVIVACDSSDYARIRTALENGGVPEAMRRELALKVFERTAAYDAAISAYLQERLREQDGADSASGESNVAMPRTMAMRLQRVGELAYGENPHQQAAFYVDATAATSPPELLQGKALSYNNIADADAAWACVCELSAPACAIIKHATPCGVACGDALSEAYVRALEADALSAFGGVIAFNRPLDEATASEIAARQFAEVVVAPEVDSAALRVLAKKNKLKVLRAALPDARARQMRSVNGGFLAQTADVSPASGGVTRETCEVVTARAPSEDEWRDLLFAWHVVGHVRSNAIVFAREVCTTGIGGGQPNRVGAVRMAAAATPKGVRAVMASDAFFPFRDGLDVAADAGVTALIQPGGSVKDEESIAAANDRGMAMALTRIRRFKH